MDKPSVDERERAVCDSAARRNFEEIRDVEYVHVGLRKVYHRI